MDAETKKLIQEQFAKLPKQLQDAIQSSHVKEQVAAIAQSHKLHIDQMDPFENEVMLLMLGFTDPFEFIGELKSILSIDADTAQTIATDVNQHILLPIREKMENSEPFEEPKAPSVPPAITNAPVAPAATAPVGEKSVVMPSAIKAAAAPTTPIADIKPPVAASASTPATGPISNPVSLSGEALAKSGAPATPAKLGNQVTIPVAPTQPTPAPAAKPSMPPVVTTVAPTTPVAPKVDEVLLKPTISAAPKVAETTPAATPAPVAPQTPAASTTPPPPPEAHAVDPYREPIN